MGINPFTQKFQFNFRNQPDRSLRKLNFEVFSSSKRSKFGWEGIFDQWKGFISKTTLSAVLIKDRPGLTEKLPKEEEEKVIYIT